MNAGRGCDLRDRQSIEESGVFGIGESNNIPAESACEICGGHQEGM